MADHADDHASDDGAPRVRIPTIERAELVAALASPAPPLLFEVLPPGFWRKNHLPGALNAPPESAVAIITAAAPATATPIVLYCWDPG